jgi:hypothetical protein
MLFAVFEVSVGSQEHDANQPTPTGIIEKSASDLQSGALIRLAFFGPAPAKIAVRGRQLVKFG